MRNNLPVPKDKENKLIGTVINQLTCIEFRENFPLNVNSHVFTTSINKPNGLYIHSISIEAVQNEMSVS